jgi:folate-binding protein YgfZ
VQAYQALHEGAAWLDISARGHLRATGEDRLRLLHAIASNSLDGLAPGQGVYTFFLNPQGQIQSDARVFVAEEHVLLDCEPEVRERLQAHLESFIIMDDVTLEDVTNETFLIAVAGLKSAAAVAQFCDSLPTDGLSFSESKGLRVVRASLIGGEGFWLSGRRELLEAVREQLRAAGVIEGTDESFEIVRAENGVPRYGVDFSQKNIPHETQQLNAVSFTKGCYTGQEIVERVRSQGRVNRLLIGLRLDAPSRPANLEVRFGDRAVGAMTSAVFSPKLQKVVGFAIVRREAAIPGTLVTVDGTPGVVTDVSEVTMEAERHTKSTVLTSDGSK